VALFGISVVGGNKTVSVVWRDQESSTTGRVGYRADLWAVLRGYDEEGIMGSGCGCKACARNKVLAIYSRGFSYDNRIVLGHPLPEGPRDARADRITANINQCYNQTGLTWEQMPQKTGQS